MSKVTASTSITEISKVFGQAMGARSVGLVQLPEFGLKQKYTMHAAWDIEIDTLKGPKGIAESFEDFWERATAVIQMPKVAELRNKLVVAEATIARLEREKAGLQRYKDAWELNK